MSIVDLATRNILRIAFYDSRIRGDFVSKKKTVNVAAIQLPCVSDVQENLNRTEEAIRSAAHKGADLICLQELFSSLYFCQSEDHEQFQLAETVPSPMTERISSLAAELSVVIIAPVFERRAPGLFQEETNS